jgi:hypothetical protein
MGIESQGIMIITDFGIIFLESGYSQDYIIYDGSDIKIEFFIMISSMEYNGDIMINIIILEGVIVGKD